MNSTKRIATSPILVLAVEKLLKHYSRKQIISGVKYLLDNFDSCDDVASASFEPKPNSISKKVFCIYLMTNAKNGLIKIGIAENPKFRERTLQSEEPEIVLLRKWIGTHKTERELHKMFSKFRVRGEWFRLDHYQVKSIEQFMESLQ